MGLDMHLTKHTKITGGMIAIAVNANGERQNCKDICEIVEEIGYWRKCYYVHSWFIEHCQNGNDDGGQYAVSCTQLVQLRNWCTKTCETFGISDNWRCQCEQTLDMLTKVGIDNSPNVTYKYQSSS